MDFVKRFARLRRVTSGIAGSCTSLHWRVSLH